MIILPIEQNIPDKIEKYLSESEINHFRALSKVFEDRSRQWLAGRIAAKKAIQKNFSHKLKLPDIEISKTKLGQPYYNNLNISISHTNDFAVADVSVLGLIGIDIETIREFPLIVYENFLTSEEKEWLGLQTDFDHKIATTLLWSLKESILKALGTGLRIHPSKIQIISKQKIFQAHAMDINPILWYNINNRDNYVITRAIIKK